MKKRRKFKRLLGERRYRKLFIISVEGARTEPQYFSMFNRGQSVVKVACLKSDNDSAPSKVLNRMKRYLREQSLRKSDEAWLVVDKDQWSDEQLAELYDWSNQKDNYGFALSNPKFEYWLLLHFEDGAGVSSSRNCVDRLRRHLPDYEKYVDVKKFSDDRVREAIVRGRIRDNPPCADWPRSTGITTVYRLVEKLV